jgi:formylmethanofuran dehydrogenase subunit A
MPVTYHLDDEDDVTAYLERAGEERTAAFEAWRARRIADGFTAFTVDHPGNEYIRFGPNVHRIAPADE